MANMEKIQFPALDITGTNYISWVTNVELHLESLGLSETIKENNTSIPQDKAKSKDITLPLARDEWQSLRFQDFDKVMNYNSAVLEIVAKLRYCGDTITKSQMLEKTYTTFHKSHITLQQQYRKNNEFLIKNHMTRPTGSKAFPEANTLDAKKTSERK
ncbi:uncharacterized protein LOC130505892 [Raphanus sativus]|uniref:Uncharacterized protein LOC130505892 n=1 Tax=Raphanus sativus TaxID=3726 RepID=A0A9W3CY20_RAPSA|nr:uncharacterized protein LOC130505892 [Raphanus sativus]